MNSTGSLDSEAGQPDAPMTRGQRAASAVVVVVGLLVLVVVIFAGFQVVGILSGILYPPLPPLPGSMTEVSHVNEAHGVDTWRYLTNATSVDLAAFYTDHGGTCNIRAPRTYLPDAQLPVTCAGQTTFSIFAMRWDVVVTPDRPENVVRLHREVYWIGAPPAAS